MGFDVIEGRRSTPAEFSPLEDELQSLPVAIDPMERVGRSIDNDTCL